MFERAWLLFGLEMSFSDRLGITEPKSALQIEEMDSALRNGLWQACLEHPIRVNNPFYPSDTVFQRTMSKIYVDFFKLSSDNVPYGHEKGTRAIRDWFFEAKWWSVYNFVEFLLPIGGPNFSARVSTFLEREKSGYRILDGNFASITDPVEIDAINEATSSANIFVGAREHLRVSVDLFAKKPQPDYRNSIKEAISAVESAAKVISGNPKATLGDALKAINDKMTLHPALREAMNRLYGYTSDEGGIRHALLEESNIDEAEAKFMIVACSAFVNLCVQRSGA
jgi:hypothetical protein